MLKEPHRLYRRVRDKDGNLKLSQAAQKYHPGTGVYRSSYKNAMRVARTEVNMAYQASDSERWTRSWWVKGIRVSLSNNHTSPDSKGRPAPLVDICDELAGDYPADFKFTGWHPQCRCFATAITCEYSDIREYYKRKRAGEDMAGYTPPGTITEPPEQFKRWMADNSERLAGAAKRGTTPYFIANNAKYTGPNWENKKTSKAHNSEANKNDQAETIESAVKRVEEVANIIIKNGYHSSREAQMPPLNIGAVPSLIVEYATQNQISLGSSDLYITTKGIEHTIRESKVAKGINIAVSELIDFVKNRDSYTIYFDSAMGDFIFATSKAKFIVRPNYKMKIGKEGSIQLYLGNKDKQ